ncbi:hypothetical protein [Streptomyces cacaoi]|uniref:hypothetical protein n=1 Tax=Streptomyces cacaoi TaxID=1898 RepID=UPI0011F38969|nr:hypothetical protein [Streptomyces cacaoi]
MSIATGARHLRTEWGRWWNADDQTDTHIAHRILNDQYRLWRGLHQRTKAEVRQNIGLMKQQQKQATHMQMQRMHAMKQMRGRGGGGFLYGMGMGGASPMVSYRMMQWAQLEIRIGQEEFAHTEVTPGMLAVGRGQLRARRHRAAAGTLLAVLAAWAGIWWASPLAALAVLAATGAVFTAAAAVAGRRRGEHRPPVPRLLFVPPKPPAHTDLAEPDPEPFALREAGRTPKVARDAMTLALRRHQAPVAEVSLPAETAYGWRYQLVLSSGTVADIIRLLPRIATTLRVGASRILARAADPDDAALVQIQVLTSDPFADPLPYPERPPGSCSITTPVSIGLSIEGETTPVVLAGQHVLIVADTGGGKTGMVQALAEYATACADAAVVDIDPVKRGLKALAPCAVRRARTPQEAEDVLDELLQLARDRIATLPPTQDSHHPTPDAPAVLAFLDEFPQLSDRGKTLAVQLLRTGREARVSIVLCTQDATRDALSDAIADVFGVRILMPCRAADVPLVVGLSDAVSRGWLPHHLIPSPDEHDPADAGKFYAITPRHRDPILRYVSPLPPAEADRRARERVAAGLPTLTPSPAVPPQAPEIARLLLKIFATEGDPPALPVARLADHLAAADPAVWGRWDGRKDRTTMVGRTLRTELKKAGLDVPTVRLDSEPGRPTAYRLTDLHTALT